MSSLRNSYRQVANPQTGVVLRAMTIDGTPLGIDAMNANYAGNPTKFYVQPNGSNDWSIASFTISISATSAKERTDYGSIAGGLLNGIDFFVEIDGVETIVTQGNKIKTNQDLIRNGREFHIIDFNSSDDTLFATANFMDFSDGFILRGTHNEKFGVIINDDLSGLTQHQIFVKIGNLGPRII